MHDPEETGYEKSIATPANEKYLSLVCIVNDIIHTLLALRKNFYRLPFLRFGRKYIIVQ
jgi:hypothetical protein